ncbi:MAG: inositol monophosphatase [Clostridiales bacterium]|nr:inositol monophosphatase [Clostridiales bacterium]
MSVLQTVDFDEIISIIKSASGLFHNEEAAENVTIKGRADFVTEVDLAVQKTICKRLAAKYPDIQFMGEEKDNSDIDFDKAVWILDPVDGTTNLIHHYQENCISLALYECHRVVAGFIYNPWHDELFFAKKNGGAFLNGEPIHVRECSDLADCLISVGTAPYSHERADFVFHQIKNVFLRVADIRRIGSAALELAYIACGRLDAYFEPNLKPWDFAAGMLIVAEAGGKVTDFEGNPITPEHPQDILASNDRIHREMIEVLNQ